MSEAFERDVIDRLARIETRLDGWETRLSKLEGIGKNHSLGGVAGGGIGAVMMAGLAAILKLLGWL